MKARWPLWPRTLFGQLLLAVLVALIAALLLGVRLLMADRDHFISMMRSQIMAQRLARIVLIKWSRSAISRRTPSSSAAISATSTASNN
jgi:hypothetical protein